jgi:hypothetical protein
MVVDAAFTSIGLNYFTAVVPRVETFSKRFVVSGRIRNLRELAEADINELREVWRNRRSWAIAKGIASYALWLNFWALSPLFATFLAIPVTFSALISDSLYPFTSRPIAMLQFLSYDELLEEGR